MMPCAHAFRGANGQHGFLRTSLEAALWKANTIPVSESLSWTWVTGIVHTMFPGEAGNHCLKPTAQLKKRTTSVMYLRMNMLMRSVN